MTPSSIIGVSIPVVAIILGIGAAMLAMYFDFRKKRELIQTYHAERMAAIEKGIELPPLPIEYLGDTRYSSPARARRTGLILLFLGIAITLGLWGMGIGDGLWWWGLVPLGLGLAFLLIAWFEARDSRRSGEQSLRSDLP